MHRTHARCDDLFGPRVHREIKGHTKAAGEALSVRLDESRELRSSGWLTGNPHLTRRWPFGRVTEGLPTNRELTDVEICCHISEKPVLRPVRICLLDSSLYSDADASVTTDRLSRTNLSRREPRGHLSPLWELACLSEPGNVTSSVEVVVVPYFGLMYC